MAPTHTKREESITTTRERINLKVKVLFTAEGGNFVAYAPSLGLASQGETMEEAKQSFEEALEIFLEETDKRGTLEKILLKHGWTLRQIPKIRYRQPNVPSELLHRAESTMLQEFTVPIGA